MKNYNDWISEKTSEDVSWLIKVYGTLTKAYEAYINEYLAENTDGC